MDGFHLAQAVIDQKGLGDRKGSPAFVSADGSSADSFFNRPVVAVGERLAGAGSIAIDNRLAARRAVEHLIQLGHERIGLVTGPIIAQLPTPVPEQRRLGYEDALRDAGLTLVVRSTTAPPS